MELGNMFFGHSRGEYPIERESGWEHELNALFHRIEPNEEYGVPDFENDTFVIRRYWWGDCSCGWETFFDSRMETWNKNNPHGLSCYRTRVNNDLAERGWSVDRWGVMNPPSKDHKKHDRERDSIQKKWCNNLGLTYPDGCAIHCTCDHDNKYNEFVSQLLKEFGGGDEGHKQDCPLVLPNFLHKPSGFSIRWYKYPLRDSYKNQDIGLRDFVKIIDDCIKSLGGK